MAAPIFAGTPFSTRISSLPSSSASRSNVALSDSTSASTSPLCTSSPLDFFHSTMVPSSIVSDSFGMFTSGIGFLTHGLADQSLDILGRRDRRLLEREAVRHGHLRAAEPEHRRVEVVEAALLDAGGQLGGDPERRPALLDDHRPRGPVDGPDDGRPVDGPD